MSNAGHQSGNSKIDKELILHHIDKIYSTQTRIWDSANRIMIVQVALSIIVIALSSGVISVEEGVEISGIKFKISFAVLLSTCALMISAFYAGLLFQMRHSDNFRAEIKRLYKLVGYEAPDLADAEIDAFEMPGFFDSITAPAFRRKKYSSKLVQRYNAILAGVTLLSVLIVIPVGAQIAAGLKVVALLGWNWLAFIPFAILVVLTVSVLAMHEDVSDKT